MKAVKILKNPWNWRCWKQTHFVVFAPINDVIFQPKPIQLGAALPRKMQSKSEGSN